MSGKQGRFATLRISLRAGAAALVMGATGTTAFPEAAAFAQSAPAPAEEISRYHLRLMRQEFDGARESSHTQVAGVARQRRGEESWLEVNFGRGALVSAVPGTTSVGGFNNTSGVETGLRYDHVTRTLSGDAAVADFHNNFVRPLLGRAPAAGDDATWTISVTPAQLGLAALGAQPMTIEISRRRFRHDGREYTLLHYRVPSFTYAAQGRPVVHWGEGVALTDAATGQVYWNAALHRAVASEAGGSGRPYRMARTMAGLDARGRPLIDPRRIAETAPYFERLYGHANDEVMGFVTRDGQSDQSPLTLASRIDVAALSLAEGGAGPAAQLASAYAQGQRGEEVALPPPTPLARAARPATPTAGAPQAAPDPSAATTATGSAAGDAMKRAPATKGGGQAPPPPPPDTLQQDVEEGQRYRSVIGAGGTWADIPIGSPDEAREFNIMSDGLRAWQQAGQSLAQEYTAAQQRLAATQRELQLRALPEMQIRPEFASRQAQAVGEMEQTAARTVQMQREYEAVVRNGLNDWARADALDDFEIANRAHLAALERYQTFMRTPDIFEFAVPPADTAMAARAQREAAELERVGQRIASHGQEGASLASRIQDIPPTRFRTFTNTLGTFLGPIGIALDSYTVGASLANTQEQLRRDPTTGNVTLTRQYGAGNTLFWVDIGADLLGLAGSALTGDVPGTIASAAAIATSSITDTLLAARGLRAVNELNRQITEESTRLAREQRIRYGEASAAREAAFRAEMARLGAEIEELDELPNVQETSRQRLAEFRARREEAARQAAAAERAAEAERQALIAAARAENERIYQENLRRPPTAAEWAQFNRDIEAAMRPDYPTAPPPSPAQVAERLARAEQARRQEIARAAAAAAQAAAAAARAEAEVRARQAALAQANAESVANREAEAQARRERNDAAANRPLNTSSFNVQPVNFRPPAFTPPVWVPPVWVPPTFDPPDPSEIPWTNFDDDDWPGGAENLAYQYENMSGRVETDLSRWAEWLATQNVRELTRLALLAGYPNLASALADAENLIRQSQDEGYRRWAMQAPSCGGYVGCGPSYLERWWMKQATVRLGDILGASRDIFSSGGFSDIGISGLNLAYLLRDNALQDGDIVDVRITQFGRTLFQGRTNLTNLGDRFNILLRQGVASLEIFAVNEGSASPNTAQIAIDNVVRGNGTQSYSLRTGQTATLRIETNARRQ